MLDFSQASTFCVRYHMTLFRIPRRRYTLHGLDARAALEVLAVTSRAHGFATTTERTDTGYRLCALRKAAWPRVLIGALAQRIEWELVEAGTLKVDVYYVRRWFAWYRGLVLLLALPVGLLWESGFSSLFALLRGEELGSSNPILMPWIGMAVMIGFAHVTLPSYDVQLYFEVISHECRKRRAVLERLNVHPLDRTTLTGIVLLLYALGFTIPVLTKIPAPRSFFSGFQLSLFASIGISVAIVVYLLRGFRMGTSRLGADERFAAMAPSLNLMIALLALVGGQLSMSALAQIRPRMWRKLFTSVGVPLHEWAGDQSSTLPLDPGQMRTLIAVMVSITIAFWIASCFFAIRSIRVARLCQLIASRIHLDVKTASARSAASASGFMKSFVKTYQGLWFLFAFLTFLGAQSLASTAGGALAYETSDQPCWGTPYSIQAGINAVALLTQRSDSDTFIQFAVRSIFVVWGGIIPLLIFVSAFDLAHRRLGRRFRLKIATSDEMRAGRLKPIANKLATHLCQYRVGLVLLDDPRCFARAYVSLLSRRQWIEISSAAIDLLDEEELGAIVAHELAHCVLGHTRDFATREWLGRFTLVGSTYMAAIFDSFGAELAADEEAIRRFGIAPRVLKRALLKLHLAAWISAAQTSNEGLEPPLRTLRTPSENEHWYTAWLRLYRGEPPLAYWHPSVAERIERLERLEYAASDNPAAFRGGTYE